MQDAFWLYAMECEGDLPTPQGRLNQAVDMLLDCDNPNSVEVQEQIFQQVGLSMNSLTYGEARYIEEEVSRQWRM
jgi:hypothetical protein